MLLVVAVRLGFGATSAFCTRACGLRLEVDESETHENCRRGFPLAWSILQFTNPATED